MTAVATPPLQRRLYEPEDLLSNDGKAIYELIDGQRVAKPMGMKSGIVGNRLGRMLGIHCEERGLGFV